MGRGWTARDILTERVSDADIDRRETECEHALYGAHPGVQGVVLASLLAKWIRGHDPSMQQRVLLNHIKGVNALIDAPFEVRLRQDPFNRWIIIHPHNGEVAWSGSRWVPISGFGLPAGDTQVCNFDTKDDAQAYAKGRGFEVIE